jgi:hypothetical protein
MLKPLPDYGRAADKHPGADRAGRPASAEAEKVHGGDVRIESVVPLLVAEGS